MWAVDTDAVDERRGVGCGGSKGSLFKVNHQRAADSLFFMRVKHKSNLTWVVNFLPICLVNNKGDKLPVLCKIVLDKQTDNSRYTKAKPHNIIS